MQISLRASLASRMIKARTRIGFDFKRARNFQWLFSNKKISYVPHQHVLDSFLEFAKALGLTTDKIEWNLPVPESAQQFVHNNLAADKYIVINPSASNAVRNWSAKNYAAVIDFLFTHYQLVTVLTGGPAKNEINFSTEIAGLAQHTPVMMTGKTTLKQLAALLQQAQFVIAPDTGPAHIASAVGTPVIGLYANSNPYRTGPYSSIERTVNKYPEALWQTYHKTPEQVRWGRRVRRDDVMDFICYEEVTDKIDQCVRELSAE
jgi:heptosyltransferase I